MSGAVADTAGGADMQDPSHTTPAKSNGKPIAGVDERIEQGHRQPANHPRVASGQVAEPMAEQVGDIRPP
jgi:hypothetical protein